VALAGGENLFPAAQRGVRVLCEDDFSRLFVFVETDLDHLPVALMIADPEKRERVVVVEEPVLEPELPPSRMT
jgi:hypothetical protein